MRVRMFQEVDGALAWPSGVKGCVLLGLAFPIGSPALFRDPFRALGGRRGGQLSRGCQGRSGFGGAWQIPVGVDAGSGSAVQRCSS